jgi:predicted porin
VERCFTGETNLGSDLKGSPFASVGRAGEVKGTVFAVFVDYWTEGKLVMKKLLMGLAATGLAAGAAGSAFAQSNVTIYGSLDTSVAFINNLNGGSVSRVDQGTMQPDRLGFRGSEDLGGGLRANFQLETGFSTDTGAQSNATTLFNRLSIVGLSGDFGAVVLGRMPDMVFDYVGKLSNAYQLTNWYLFHPGNLDNLANTFQVANSVRYTSPTFSGLQLAGMYGFGEVAGDNTNGRNVSTGANYANGAFRAALAYSLFNNRPAGFGGTYLASQNIGSVATVFNSISTIAAGVGYTIGDVGLNADYTQVKLDLPALNPERQRNFDLGAAWHYHGAETLNAGYSLSRLEGARWNTVSLGNSHAFSKRTQAFAQITYQHASGAAQVAVLNGTGAAGGTGVSSSGSQMVVSIGMHHSF